MKPQLCSVWLNCVNHTTLKYLPHRHCWDTSMCLSQLDGEVSAVCRKINYLHPLLLLQRAGKPFNPRFGEGGCGGELPVTRQPLSHLPRHAKISHLPLEAAFTRYTAAFKSLLSGIHMENKTSTKTQQNYVALGKKVWCDYIAFSLVWERGSVSLLRSHWALLKKGREQNLLCVCVCVSIADTRWLIS